MNKMIKMHGMKLAGASQVHNLNVQELAADPALGDIKGRVVWTNTKSKAFPAGMGIQFIDMAPTHQDKIKIFVDEHSKEIKSKSFL